MLSLLGIESRKLHHYFFPGKLTSFLAPKERDLYGFVLDTLKSD